MLAIFFAACVCDANKKEMGAKWPLLFFLFRFCSLVIAPFASNKRSRCWRL
jgi:hypothetical protein